MICAFDPPVSSNGLRTQMPEISVGNVCNLTLRTRISKILFAPYVKPIFNKNNSAAVDYLGPFLVHHWAFYIKTKSKIRPTQVCTAPNPNTITELISETFLSITSDRYCFQI